MSRLSLAVVAAVALAVVVPATAAGSRVDARQRAQHARIADGVRDGQLTRPEAHRMVKQQRHIRQAERRANADGIVTRQEKRQLNHMQNRAGMRIHRQKHDCQQRAAQ